MKKIVRALFVAASCICISGLYSCSNKKNDSIVSTGIRPAKGDRYYGGVFRLNESEYIKNLFPHSIIDTYSYRVSTQIYEGLFKFDQRDLHLIPCLIDTHFVDQTNTVYTFKLRDNVFFHDDACFPGGKGRKMVAEDVKYCFTMACTESRTNQAFNLFDGIIKGAREYYNATTGGKKPDFELEGIKVIDDLTLQITITAPNSMFLFNLARPGAFIFPKEAYDTYGIEMRNKCVGTGPFRVSSIEDDISIVLRRNENYHDFDEFGNQLPFFDAINIRFIKDKKTELLEFKNNNLDMMYRLPTDYIIEIIEEDNSEAYKNYELDRKPEMYTQMLVLNNRKGVFKDPNVRKAFSFAIDREKILNYVLNGEGFMEGYHGITPPVFKAPTYETGHIKGYTLNVDSANFYMRKAGYPNGQGFPKISLDLNVEGERYTNVAQEIQKQLNDHLNIKVELNIYPISQLTEKATSGDYDMLRLAWVADYPSPENYLWFFYGKNVPPDGVNSYPNLTRYQNQKFDELYEKAIQSTDLQDAFEYFLAAEKLMIQDAPAIFLWYDEGFRIVKSKVKNFPNNPMQYRDFSAVYFVPDEPASTTAVSPTR